MGLDGLGNTPSVRMSFLIKKKKNQKENKQNNSKNQMLVVGPVAQLVGSLPSICSRQLDSRLLHNVWHSSTYL